jgi:hypothetical protein
MLAEEAFTDVRDPSNLSSTLRAPNYEYGGPLAVLGEDSLCMPRSEDLLDIR